MKSQDQQPRADDHAPSTVHMIDIKEREGRHYGFCQTCNWKGDQWLSASSAVQETESHVPDGVPTEWLS